MGWIVHSILEREFPLIILKRTLDRKLPTFTISYLKDIMFSETNLLLSQADAKKKELDIEEEPVSHFVPRIEKFLESAMHW